jgi:hypothetical protein
VNAAHPREDRVMDERQTLARLRVEEIRAEFAMRDEERRMSREEQKMEDEIRQLENSEKGVETEIEQEWRREHWGHEPERPPAWKIADGQAGAGRDHGGGLDR